MYYFDPNSIDKARKMYERRCENDIAFYELGCRLPAELRECLSLLVDLCIGGIKEAGEELWARDLVCDLLWHFATLSTLRDALNDDDVDVIIQFIINRVC